MVGLAARLAAGLVADSIASVVGVAGCAGALWAVFVVLVVWFKAFLALKYSARTLICRSF